MKKIKIILLALIIVSLTGCFKRDDFEDIDIYTTYYPISYLTEELYGNYSDITSIYPSGVDIKNYKLTDKQIKKYSKSNVFIYNGLSEEKDIAVELINQNENINIIDIAQGITINGEMEELWLSPANYLMMAQNIKNGLKEHVTSKYIKNEIDANYESLKLSISEIEAELKIINENASYKTIIVDSPMFKFLEKYGYEVIVLLNEENTISITAYNRAKDLYSTKQNNYLFIKEGNAIDEKLKKLIDDYKLVKYDFKTITNLSEEEKENNSDYLTIMKTNVEAIRNEMYTEK